MIVQRARRALPSYATGQIARHSASSLAVKLFSIGCAFLFAVIVARTLGARGYGIVAFAISVATVVSIFSQLGINGFAVRAIAGLQTQGDAPHIRAFVRWSTTTVLVASTIVAIIVAFASLVGGPYRTALLMSALAIPLLAQLSLQRGIAQGNGKIVAGQLPLDVVRWIFTLAILGGALAAGVSISAPLVLTAVLVALTAALVIALLVTWRSLAEVSAVAQARHRQWFRDSLPFLGIAFLGIVGTEINTLLLGVLAGPREAGLYQPIARLAQIMILAREALDMPLAPRIVHLWATNDREKLRQLVRRSAAACTAATTVICLLLLVASPFIFAAFGAEFESYRGYLFWIAGAQIVNAALSPAPMLLTMVGSMRQRVQAQVATVVVQVGLSLILVPVFGVAGAVASLTCAIIVWSVLHWVMALRSTGIDALAFSGWRKSRSPQR